MKRSVTLLLLAILAVTSCGTASQFAAEQSFYDGIYYKPAKVRKVKLKTDEEFVELAAANIRNKEMDTTVLLVVPKDKVNVIIGFDLGWGFGWNRWFGPRFGWYGSWGWDPWYYSWYDPWFYPWYDPWYRPWGPGPWGPYPWYDPWWGPGPYGPMP
ncbi:MAG: Slp family lipoprotein, partial [Bacteroidales bacterium]|nr:Slp family lipoprotein [Bacteroidales bacterium]